MTNILRLKSSLTSIKKLWALHLIKRGLWSKLLLSSSNKRKVIMETTIYVRKMPCLRLNYSRAERKLKGRSKRTNKSRKCTIICKLRIRIFGRRSADSRMKLSTTSRLLIIIINILGRFKETWSKFRRVTKVI